MSGSFLRAETLNDDKKRRQKSLGSTSLAGTKKQSGICDYNKWNRERVVENRIQEVVRVQIMQNFEILSNDSRFFSKCIGKQKSDKIEFT